MPQIPQTQAEPPRYTPDAQSGRPQESADPVRLTGVFLGLYALTIFFSAFLLFQVQPLIAKFILPWFGGTPAVWTTCMLFFQLFLLAGYTYAHLSSRFLSAKAQTSLHVALLILAVCLLPVVPGTQWKPSAETAPAGHILAMLTCVVGMPYFLLAATGPLLQSWFGKSLSGRTPYRLYAVSNLGSLLALASFPFVFEPLFPRMGLAVGWSFGFAIFGILCAFCALRFRSSNHHPSPGPATTEGAEPTRVRIPFTNRLFWFALPACATVLLLATTNKVCQDVATIPFLWILPLGLYLASFIVCFAERGGYWRWFYHGLLLTYSGLLLATYRIGPSLALPEQFATYFGGLFIICMICHGEVYRLRPPVGSLTSYYLMISAGGAAGGFFVAVLAPLIFTSFAELPWGIAILSGLLVVLHLTQANRFHLGKRSLPVWPLILISFVVTSVLMMQTTEEGPNKLVVRARNFYGVVRVEEVHQTRPLEHSFALLHGVILHGLQFTHPSKSTLPTTYFGEESGVGLTLNGYKPSVNRRIGVLGLGVGTLATYGRSGDLFRFYEINPMVKELAENHFSFLKESKAQVDVIVGDGRLVLESQEPQDFDILILDAFSGDAVPVHLLTQEAFAVYLRHIKPKGVIIANITNIHLDLLPVARGIAQQLHLGVAHLPWDPITKPWYLKESDFVAWSRDKDFLQSLENRVSTPWARSKRLDSLLWTDEYASLFPLLKH